MRTIGLTRNPKRRLYRSFFAQCVLYGAGDTVGTIVAGEGKHDALAQASGTLTEAGSTGEVGKRVQQRLAVWVMATLDPAGICRTSSKNPTSCVAGGSALDVILNAKQHSSLLIRWSFIRNVRRNTALFYLGGYRGSNRIFTFLLINRQTVGNGAGNAPARRGRRQLQSQPA